MSEGQSESLRGDPTCAVVLARLWTLIDGECASAICEALLRHLDDCEGCMDQFSRDARLKLLIATKCGGDKAPKRFRRWRPEGSAE
jgi:mycothiol system anti-sigma-R factor